MNKIQSLADILSNLEKKNKTKKRKIQAWQGLALKVISDLGVPNFKKSAVFKVCKENSEQQIITALNDTKELCQTGDCWKYFFKIIDNNK